MSDVRKRLSLTPKKKRNGNKEKESCFIHQGKIDKSTNLRGLTGKSLKKLKNAG